MIRHLISTTAAAGVLALAGCVSDGHRSVPTAVLQDGLPTEYQPAAADNARFLRGAGEHAADGEPALGPNVPATTLTGQVTLADCLRASLARSESLAISAEDYVQTLLSRDAVVANMRPDIYLRGSHSQEERTDGGEFGGSRGYSTQVSIGADIPVWHGWRNVYAKLNREALSRSQAKSMLDIRNGLSLDVTEAYYAALQAKAAVASQELNVTLSQERLTTIEKLIKGGVARKGDLLTTQAEVAQAKANRERARETLRLAMEQLSFVAGVRIEGELTTPPPMTRGTLVLDTLLDRAMQNRPDLKALEELLVARRAEEEFIRRERYPDVDLDVNAYPIRDGANEDVHWDATLSVEVPIYQSGRHLTEVRAVQSQIRQAQLAIQEQRRRIDLDLRQAMAEVDGSAALLTALQEQVTAARDAYEQVQKEFQAGATRNLEVTAAQTALLSAELDYEAETLRNEFLHRRLQALTGGFLAADLNQE